MNKQSVSVVISAYNEEKKIKDCLESVRWADEIIVVNNSSTDSTLEIAKKYTAHIFTVPNNLMLNKNKNFGFSKAKGPWILSLDADERILPELRQEIEKILQEDTEAIDGYFIPRKNIIFGKWIQNSIWWPDYQLRLFKKNSGKFLEKHVHEMLEVKGQTAKLTHPMHHENYSTVSQYIHKMDKIYTENEADLILKSGKSLHWSDSVRMPVNDFLKTFFFQKGYKDGLHGLVLSLLQAVYALIVFAKVWERRDFREHNDKNFLFEMYNHSQKLGREINYWFLTSFMNETHNKAKRLYYKILRKKTL